MNVRAGCKHRTRIRMKHGHPTPPIAKPPARYIQSRALDATELRMRQEGDSATGRDICSTKKTRQASEDENSDPVSNYLSPCLCLCLHLCLYFALILYPFLCLCACLCLYVSSIFCLCLRLGCPRTSLRVPWGPLQPPWASPCAPWASL